MALSTRYFFLYVRIDIQIELIKLINSSEKSLTYYCLYLLIRQKVLTNIRIFIDNVVIFVGKTLNVIM